MAILFKLGLPHGACYTTDNYESVTLWRPPNEWDVPFWAYIVNGPALLSACFGSDASQAWLSRRWRRWRRCIRTTPH